MNETSSGVQRCLAAASKSHSSIENWKFKTMTKLISESSVASKTPESPLVQPFPTALFHTSKQLCLVASWLQLFHCKPFETRCHLFRAQPHILNLRTSLSWDFNRGECGLSCNRCFRPGGKVSIKEALNPSSYLIPVFLGLLRQKWHVSNLVSDEKENKKGALLFEQELYF